MKHKHGSASVERFRLPEREERPMPVPNGYRMGSGGNWLLSDDILRRHLWRHQALALEVFGVGNNAVLSTETRSGKLQHFQREPGEPGASGQGEQAAGAEAQDGRGARGCDVAKLRQDRGKR